MIPITPPVPLSSDESRPGSFLYNPHYNFDDTEFSYDPYGYYSCNKLVVDIEDADYSLVEEYPLTAYAWNYDRAETYLQASAIPKNEEDQKSKLDEAHQ